MTYHDWLDSLNRQQFEDYISGRIEAPEGLEGDEMKPRKARLLTTEGIVALMLLAGAICFALGAVGIGPFSDMFHTTITTRLTHD